MMVKGVSPESEGEPPSRLLILTTPCVVPTGGTVQSKWPTAAGTLSAIRLQEAPASAENSMRMREVYCCVQRILSSWSETRISFPTGNVSVRR